MQLTQSSMVLPLMVCSYRILSYFTHLSGLKAASIFSDATSLGGEVATKVTCASSRLCQIHGPGIDNVVAIGGSVFTEVTSVGGEAITLAGSGVGVVTTFAGSVYTVVTRAAASAVTASDSKYESNPANMSKC
jgi:hypothetical protein